MRPDPRKLIAVAGAALVVAAGYYGYALLFGAGPPPLPEDSLSDFGEALGGVNLSLFAFLYGRIAWRFMLESDSFRACLPVVGAGDRAGWPGMIATILDRYHAPAGVAAMVAIYLHAWLMTRYQTNPLLYAVLVLVAWQGLFGVFLKLRRTPAGLRRKSYSAHAQLYTGVTILICAVFGHLLHGGD